MKGHMVPQQQNLRDPGYVPSHVDTSPLNCRLVLQMPGASSYAPPDGENPTVLTFRKVATTCASEMDVMFFIPLSTHDLPCEEHAAEQLSPPSPYTQSKGATGTGGGGGGGLGGGGGTEISGGMKGHMVPQQQNLRDPGYVPSHVDTSPLNCRLVLQMPGASSYAPPDGENPTVLTFRKVATACASEIDVMFFIPLSTHDLPCEEHAAEQLSPPSPYTQSKGATGTGGGGLGSGPSDNGHEDPQQQKRAEPPYDAPQVEPAPLYWRLPDHTPGASEYASPVGVSPATLTPSKEATNVASLAVDMAVMPDCTQVLLCAWHVAVHESPAVPYTQSELRARHPCIQSQHDES
ncbi:hypothetical protein M9435_006946 [Picochlorum sp. BPE23]|nr:hypothetical protein M9435_006946 [Picochlorum sp. BPE23]